MATVLITQCLQRDFADPVGPRDPLPNLLHAGWSEAARLLGTEPQTSALAQLIDWARSLATDAIDLIHIRDWRDPDDSAQREHLERIRHTHGDEPLAPRRARCARCARPSRASSPLPLASRLGRRCSGSGRGIP